jgi:hypothetical protein
MKAFILNKKFMLFFTMLPFFYMTHSFISLDFWNDEVYTLRHFTFVPVSTTVTDYHVPNNHIFFNLVNNIFLKITGIGDIYKLMDYPSLIRLLPFIYSIGTIFYIFLSAKKFFNDFTALLSVAILLTTLPFFNFFLQIRGYGLSMFFLTMMIYHAWSLEINFSIRDFLLLSLASCLSVYTIPLNLYFVMALGIFYLFLLATCFIKSFNKKNKQGTVKFLPRKIFYVLFALGVGTGCALLLYLPVFHQAFFNNYVKSQAEFNTSFSIPGIVFNGFLSGRLLLPVLFFSGAILFFVHRDKHQFIFFRRCVFLMCLLLLPFVISYARADNAPDRSFVILAPVFSLCAAAGIYFFTASFPKLWDKRYVILSVMVIYCDITFIFYYAKCRDHLENDITVSKRSQNIKYNYYLAYFHPDRLAEMFQKVNASHPATLVIRDSDYHGMREYLTKYGLQYAENNTLDSLLEHENTLYVLTIKPNLFRKWMHENHPDVKFCRLNSFIDFHNFYYCTRINK